MVAAILRDVNPKTMTRRPISPQPNEGGIYYMERPPLDWEQYYKERWKPWKYETKEGESMAVDSPYMPGDILCVAEEHKAEIMDCHDPFVRVEFRDGVVHNYYCRQIPPDTLKRLKARKTLGQWQRARFMPKALARIFLKVTAVRAECLQDITEQDAIAEGIESFHPVPGDGAPITSYKDYIMGDFALRRPVASFASLWESIYGRGTYALNPYVWCYTFQRIPKPETA